MRTWKCTEIRKFIFTLEEMVGRQVGGEVATDEKTYASRCESTSVVTNACAYVRIFDVVNFYVLRASALR